jgi:hypothetical protein
MLLLRLVVTALCAACLVILVSPPSIRVEVATPAVRHRAAPGTAIVRVRADAPCTIAALPAASDRPARALPASGPAVHVVDVARGVPASQIASLISLAPGEYVAAVNDRIPRSDLDAGALIASAPHPGEYVDLTVGFEGDDSVQRRVLVLLH